MKAADQDKNGTLDKNEFISFIKSRSDSSSMSSRQRANLIHFSPSIFNFHNNSSRSPLRVSGRNSSSRSNSNSPVRWGGGGGGTSYSIASNASSPSRSSPTRKYLTASNATSNATGRDYAKNNNHNQHVVNVHFDLDDYEHNNNNNNNNNSSSNISIEDDMIPDNEDHPDYNFTYLGIFLIYSFPMMYFNFFLWIKNDK